MVGEPFGKLGAWLINTSTILPTSQITVIYLRVNIAERTQVRTFGPSIQYLVTRHNTAVGGRIFALHAWHRPVAEVRATFLSRALPNIHRLVGMPSKDSDSVAIRQF